ncbi:trk system potassium uptake protein TrkH [Natranaerovirga pectinivora]|uniref:Trk system potassium uptake protein TrkH n=1 Tax=Natranaerovirga pectinivora TaxID=682400 RepID=A0A4V6NZT6_9FIRM|nr:trk system potassium uptake protein TrkH [Natranaerovirga pectinivora]
MFFNLGNIRGVQVLIIKKKKRFTIDLSPAQILVLGFLFVIFLGGFLLNLPIASRDGDSVGFINAIFTATSAVCVTGLVVVNTLAHWTLFGQIVILVLIQIGGLGFMTMTTAIFILIGRKITLKERLIIQEALNEYTLSGMVRLIRKILLGTFIIEGMGAILLSIRFVPMYGLSRGIFMSIFHSVSAFCNAGFDIIGGNSLTPFAGDLLVNVIIILLIVLGGLGFTVWWDIIRVGKEKVAKNHSFKRFFQKLTLHTKLVLVISSFLIMLGFVFFFLVEFNNPNTLGQMSLPNKILAALFQGVTPRTAGFNTFDLSLMNDASKFMTIILMFIGGSPAGTAGGVKTVTIGVIVLSVLSVIKGKERTEVFNRTIPRDVLRRALAVIVISLGVVISVTMLLSLSETGDFMDIFFESTSAFATVGLSLGFTSTLTYFGRIIIAITMFIGRLGPVTMALAFSLRSNKNKGQVKKPEERVMVG